MFTLVSYMFSLHNKPTIGVFTKVLIIRMGPTGSHPGIGTEGRGHQEPEKTGLDIPKKKVACIIKFTKFPYVYCG